MGHTPWRKARTHFWSKPGPLPLENPHSLLGFGGLIPWGRIVRADLSSGGRLSSLAAYPAEHLQTWVNGQVSNSSYLNLLTFTTSTNNQRHTWHRTVGCPWVNTWQHFETTQDQNKWSMWKVSCDSLDSTLQSMGNKQLFCHSFMRIHGIPQLMLLDTLKWSTKSVVAVGIDGGTFLRSHNHDLIARWAVLAYKHAKKGCSVYHSHVVSTTPHEHRSLLRDLEIGRFGSKITSHKSIHDKEYQNQ